MQQWNKDVRDEQLVESFLLNLKYAFWETEKVSEWLFYENEKSHDKIGKLQSTPFCSFIVYKTA